MTAWQKSETPQGREKGIRQYDEQTDEHDCHRLGEVARRDIIQIAVDAGHTSEGDFCLFKWCIFDDALRCLYDFLDPSCRL